MAFVVKSGVVNAIGAAAYWTVQPAANESWVLTAWGSAAFATMKLLLYDGTDEADIIQTVINTDGAATGNVKVFVTNSLYFRLYNGGGGAADMAYCGVLL